MLGGPGVGVSLEGCVAGVEGRGAVDHAGSGGAGVGGGGAALSRHGHNVGGVVVAAELLGHGVLLHELEPGGSLAGGGGGDPVGSPVPHPAALPLPLPPPVRVEAAPQLPPSSTQAR